MDKLNDTLWKSWADNWDRKNPSDFMKACADSRARQEEYAKKQLASKVNIDLYKYESKGR
jgi:hypothetical protein